MRKRWPDYLHDGEYRLEYATRKANELSEPNKAYVIEYKRHLDLQNKKSRTIARRLHELIYCLKLLNNDAKKANREDIETLVLSINKSNIALTSQAMIKLTLKNFYAYLYHIEQKHAYPELVSWIEIKRPKNAKQPDDLLTIEEMTTLIAACKNIRDKTVIAVLSNFGCRIGELLNLKYKDIKLTDSEVHWIKFDGKTGIRRVPFTNNSLCAPYIIEYLNQYKPDNLDAPLFITKENLPLDYKNVRRLLVHLKEWTGIRKRLHPHIFRFSASTLWAGKISESLLKMYMGWTQDSKMAAVYVKMNDDMLAQGIAKADGAEVREARPKPSTKQCIKCKEVNALTNTYCVRCGSNLDNENTIKEAIDFMNMEQKLQRLEYAIEVLYKHLDDKTKKEIENMA